MRVVTAPSNLGKNDIISEQAAVSLVVGLAFSNLGSYDPSYDGH